MSAALESDSPADLELSLAAWQRRAEELEQRIKRLSGAARKLARLAREGELSGAAGAVAAARDAQKLAADALEAAADVPRYDIAAAFAGGGYLRELDEAARHAGVKLVVRDGAISSFPVSLRLDAARAGVRIGRRLEKRLRPSFVAEQLRRLQQGPSRFNARAFASLLFRAYALLARPAQPGWKPSTPGAGPAVPLAEIHEVLTLAPGSDYPMEQFAADLLRLDRLPETQASSGHRVQFAGSTGLKGGKRLSVADEGGQVHDYFAIRFMLETGDGRSENAAAGA